MAKPSTVGVRELKTRLGGYLKHVGRGHRLIVTDRGKPVAEIRPIDASATDEAAWDRLESLGVISRRARGPLADRPPLVRRNVGLAAAVRADRDEGL